MLPAVYFKVATYYSAYVPTYYCTVVLPFLYVLFKTVKAKGNIGVSELKFLYACSIVHDLHFHVRGFKRYELEFLMLCIRYQGDGDKGKY